MSYTFRSENVPAGAIVFQPQGVATPQGIDDPGTLRLDASQNALFFRLNGITYQPAMGAITNITPVTATNPSAAANLMTFAFPAGSLNNLGRTLSLYAYGLYTTASGQTPTLNLTVIMNDGTNTRTLLSWTSGATTASSSNFPWNFDCTIVTTAAGSSGTFEGHGTANVTLGASAGGALTSYNDVITGASSALDLTKVNTMTVQCLFSSSNAGNSVTERVLCADIYN